jgi:lipoprotein-releasing system ATP-binding protein
VFQNFQLIPSLTALENVLVPLELRGLSGEETKRAEVKARALLARVGLGERLGHYPVQLSGGEQQRVAVARALANRPVLVLADEPTGNLDEGTAMKVLEAFLTLVRGEGSAALVATHNRALAERMDRIVALHEGLLA